MADIVKGRPERFNGPTDRGPAERAVTSSAADVEIWEMSQKKSETP